MPAIRDPKTIRKQIPRPAVIVAVVFNIALAITICCTGPFKQMLFGHDAWVTLAGAWKLVHGINPNRNYYSPLGLINFIPAAVSFKLFGASAAALSNAAALWIVLITALALVIFWSQLEANILGALLVFLGISVAATHHIGFPSTGTTYAASYNRYGCAILGLLTIGFLSEGFRFARHARIAFGVCLALLFFLKITYFLAGFGILGLATVLKRFSVKDALAVTSYAVFFVLTTLLIFQMSPFDIFRDLSIAAKARSSSLMNSIAALKLLRKQIFELFALCVASVFIDARRGQKKTFIITPAMTLFIALITISLFRTNAAVRAFPEVPYFNIACLFLFIDSYRRMAPAHRALAANVVVCLMLFWPSTVFHDAPGIIYGIKNTRQALLNGGDLRIDSTTLRPLLIEGNGGDPPTDGGYAAKINDGLRMLRDHLKPQSRVMTLDFTDIFALALDWPPPEGSPLFWQNGFSYTEQFAPLSESVFRGSDAVMIPRSFGTGNIEDSTALTKLYGPYIHEHFTMLAESNYWQLFGLKR